MHEHEDTGNGRARHAATAVTLAALACVAPARAERTGEDILNAQPARARAALQKQKVVITDDTADGFLTALVVFDKPVDAVMALLGQSGRQGEFRPDLVETSTLEGADGATVERQHMRYGFVDLVIHVRYDLDPAAGRIRWALDPAYPNDLKRADGFWELYALAADRTLARFGTLVDLGAPIPRFLKARATKSDLEHVRQWVDSGGTWRP